MSAVELRYHTKHIGVITLDNPPVNTLSWGSRADLIKILEELEANLDVRAVVITGAGRAFTAGANLREDQIMEVDQLPAFINDFLRILDGFELFRAPIIGAINGPAIGGGLELALACDIRIASTNATFVAAGVNVGLMANFWRLTRIVGLGRAKDILFTGDHYGAQRAYEWGLVTDVCEPDQLMNVALAKAERIASRAPLSVEATKRVVYDAPTIDVAESNRRQLEELQGLFTKEDHAEALRAFFSKSTGDYHRK